MYTLKVAAGVLVGLVWLWQRAPHTGFDRRALRFWVCGVALAALIGGRVGYVLGNMAYFTQQPGLSLRLDRVGGLHGGSVIIGALLVIGLWSIVAHRPVSIIVSFLSPAVLLVAAGAWWGCVEAGCAWGREIVPAVDGARGFTALLPDIYQMMAPRYAVQPLGAGWALLLALLAAVLGERGGLALALYWLGSAGLTLLRADPMPESIVLTGGSLRLDTVLDLALAISIALFMVLKTKGTHRGRIIGSRTS